MRPFKFFQKEVKGTLDLFDGETRATASFNADTPEGVMARRMLYYTNNSQYDRLNRQRIEDQERNERIIRRLNSERTFFPKITVTETKPKWWEKIKIVFKESWRSDPIGVTVASVLLTLVTIIGIAKLLGL